MSERKEHPAVVVMQAIVQAAIFVCLMGVVLYTYPAIDLEVYQFSKAFHSIDALTVYSVYEFGWIHTPSLFLGLWFCFSLWATPRLALGIQRLANVQVARYVPGQELEEELELEEEEEEGVAHA